MTFSEFDKIKPSSKELGDKYWTDKDMINKANEIVARRAGNNPPQYGKAKMDNAAKIVPNATKRVEEIDSTVGEKYKNIVEDIFKFAISDSIYWVNKLYPPKPEGLEALKNDDERFDMKS